MNDLPRVNIETRIADEVRWEFHRYPPGPAGALSPHIHESYQIGYSPNFPGEYQYRNELHAVPIGSLHVIHPGEVHAARDPVERDRTTVFATAYVPCSLVREAADESGAPDALPFFPPVIRDPILVRCFEEWLRAVRAHDRLGPGTLHQNTKRVAFLTTLARRCGGGGEPGTRTERETVRKIRDYLHAHVEDAVSLGDLSALVGWSPAYVNRVFRREVGLPPYRYLQRLRVERAAWRLAAGAPIAETAYATGFADQSHLTRQFKRFVGVTPGQYRS